MERTENIYQVNQNPGYHNFLISPGILRNYKIVKFAYEIAGAPMSKYMYSAYLKSRVKPKAMYKNETDDPRKSKRYCGCAYSIGEKTVYEYDDTAIRLKENILFEDTNVKSLETMFEPNPFKENKVNVQSKSTKTKTMNFNIQEIENFKNALDGQYMFGITTQGNIEFIMRSEIGNSDIVTYRVCKNKKTGKLHIARYHNGYNTYMFVHNKEVTIPMVYEGKTGTFTSKEQCVEEFDTVEEAAKRFNKYMNN